MNEFNVPLHEPESPQVIEPMQITTYSDELEEIMEHLTKLLPLITKRRKEHNRLGEWVAFFHMISSGSFDADHMAPQLF